MAMFLYLFLFLFAIVHIYYKQPYSINKKDVGSNHGLTLKKFEYNICFLEYQ